jgi:hypothetical protein
MPSDASHFSEILHVAFAVLPEEMKRLSILGMISHRFVSSRELHITQLTLSEIEESVA